MNALRATIFTAGALAAAVAVATPASAQIYSIGTALFVALDGNGHEVVLRIHNCLFSQGEFNLISVSQLCGKPENSVDLSLD